MNIKKIYKDHEVEILVTGGILLVAGAVALVTRKMVLDTERAKDLGKSIIKWTPNKKRLNLEEVKLILDEFNTKEVAYAIFKERTDANLYSVIIVG